MTPADLVYIDEHGLLGSNFYWHKYAAHGLTKEDVLNVGLTDDRVQVSAQIIDKLVEVDQELQKRRRTLYLKEGYRSRDLYDIVYKRRVEKYGKAETDAILNMQDRPHALGLSVDVAIWDPKENKEVYLRNAEDGVAALFIGFYKDKADEQSKRYQELQEHLAGLMLDRGFRVGTRREYFHFDYRPNAPRNYVV